MLDFLKKLWCVVAHKNHYEATPDKNQDAWKGVYCKKCKVHFHLDQETFDRLKIK